MINKEPLILSMVAMDNRKKFENIKMALKIIKIVLAIAFIAILIMVIIK
ncbi:hypothetical protein [Ferroplasma sp.]